MTKAGDVLFNSFVYIYVCGLVCLSDRREHPDQMKNVTNLKFSTHTVLDYINKWVFCFFRKSDPEGCKPQKTAVCFIFFCKKIHSNLKIKK